MIDRCADVANCIVDFCDFRLRFVGQWTAAVFGPGRSRAVQSGGSTRGRHKGERNTDCGMT